MLGHVDGYQHGVDEGVWSRSFTLQTVVSTTAQMHCRELYGLLRDELLNETLFPSLPHVRATAASWRTDYNLNRPHSRLGWLTPAEYADTFNPRRDLPLRSMASSASAPVAHPAQMGKTNRQSLHHAG